MNLVKKPKIISDPILGVIEATQILPLLDIQAFQSLAFKYQLGLNALIFPAATHTRKEHSLGAYERTRRLTEDWLNYNFINKDEAFALQIYALYHDIGHGPFSHVTESLGSVNHKIRGIQIVESLKDLIESVGCNFNLFHDFMSHKNSLHLAVSDRNLGTEKFDYLERDAFYALGERPGVGYLSKHVYFIDGNLVVDETAVDQAKAIQEFYIKLSKNVYLRKKGSILHRLIEKMTGYLIEDGLQEEELFNLTDFGLLGRFEVSEHKAVKFYYDRFMAGIFPKLTLEFKYHTAETKDLTEKPIKVIGLDDEIFNSIIASDFIKNPKKLNELERKISELTDVPENSLVIVPPFSKERFVPEDINVYSREGKTVLLSKIYPNHFQAMQEYGRSHIGLRVCVYGDYRRKLYNEADKVKDYLMSIINK